MKLPKLRELRPEGVRFIDEVLAAVVGTVFAVLFRPWESFERLCVGVSACTFAAIMWSIGAHWLKRGNAMSVRTGAKPVPVVFRPKKYYRVQTRNSPTRWLHSLDPPEPQRAAHLRVEWRSSESDATSFPSRTYAEAAANNAPGGVAYWVVPVQ